MGEHTKLRAEDGHEFDAYISRPNGKPTAGLVVIQEAFGVNRHIRSVVDEYGDDGFLSVAPALFDRMQRGVELGYEGEEAQYGIGLARQINPGNAVKDIAAAMSYLREQGARKVGVIGYCMGGTMAWLAATRLNPDAAVGYYGGRIAQYAGETSQCPVMLHFGKLDQHIPKEEVDKVQAAHPDVSIFWYDAGHGFNTSDRTSFNADASKLARQRSLDFLKKNLS
jgi:carboxymethylenebutenolidase